MKIKYDQFDLVVTGAGTAALGAARDCTKIFGSNMAHLLFIEGHRRDHLAHPATLDVVQMRRDHELGRDEV